MGALLDCTAPVFAGAGDGDILLRLFLGGRFSSSTVQPLEHECTTEL